MDLTQRQKYALEHPCENPFMMSRDRNYHRPLQMHNLRLSTLLTIETTAEESHWHASIAVLSSENKPISPFGNITKDDFQSILDELKKMLNGVGTGKDWTFKPETAIHLFRKLSASELAKVNKYSILRN
jgi:hypothetical protein